MSQPIAGIARNSCPRCGELTRVPWHRMLFRSWNAFRCSACHGWIIIAESTGAFALVGGLIGMMVGIGVAFRIHPRIDGTKSPLLAVLVFVALPFCTFVAGEIPFARWSLRLVPTVPRWPPRE